MSPGKLYVISTPIGNLADITFRAIEVLKSVDLVAAEDTRRTSLLLKHYGISVKQVSYHDYNKKRVTPLILEKLKQGENVGVVSDAGTPGISDPGFYLVRECLKQEIEIVPVPGASSLLAGLVISGMPTDRFCFEGFLPRTEGKLKKRLMELKDEKRTLVFFESPPRINKTLKAMIEVFGDRQAFIGRELTKKFEQTYRGSLAGLLDILGGAVPKGELILIIAGNRNDLV
jgi:16S rRNA (cytidine1402-2'-O)-methyltransferase